MTVPNFITILDKKFIQNVIDRESRKGDYAYRHNPSSASIKIGDTVHGACLRQLYYRATKEPRTGDIDATGLYQMAFGDYIHEGLFKLLQKCPEISVIPESGGKLCVDGLTLDISYRIDGLVSTNGQIGGLELKTVQGRALTAKEYGIKYTGPKLSHSLQVITYFNTFKGLSWFALVYVARDSGYRLQYDYTKEGDKYFVNGKELEDVTFEKITKRWKHLEHCLETKTIPARDFKVWLKPDGTVQPVKVIKGEFFKSDFACTYCSYQKTCWSGPDALTDSYNAKP